MRGRLGLVPAPASDLFQGKDDPAGQGPAAYADAVGQDAGRGRGRDLGFGGGTQLPQDHVPGLEDEEVSPAGPFKGEFHFLRAVSPVVDQVFGHLAQLFVNLGEMGFHGHVGRPVLDPALTDADGQGPDQAGDHVLALVAHGEIAPEHELVPGPPWIVGKTDPGSGQPGEIAKDHALDRDGCAPVVADAQDGAVGLGPVRIPAVHHPLHGQAELFERPFLDRDVAGL